MAVTTFCGSKFHSLNDLLYEEGSPSVCPKTPGNTFHWTSPNSTVVREGEKTYLNPVEQPLRQVSSVLDSAGVEQRLGKRYFGVGRVGLAQERIEDNRGGSGLTLKGLKALHGTCAHDLGGAEPSRPIREAGA